MKELDKKYEAVGIVFAGGVGRRMKNDALPKQFLKVNGKPIIVYTLEVFQRTEEIDGVIVVIVSGWEQYMRELVDEYKLTKVIDIVTGGVNTQQSQYKGLQRLASETNDETVVLIHDGVRPLIDSKLLKDNIESVKKFGSAITITPAIETITEVDDSKNIVKIVDRGNHRMARAPQSYRLGDILNVHEKAIADNRVDFIDSASLMHAYGNRLMTVEGSTENIKVTTPVDYFVFKGILEARTQRDIFGQ